MPDLDEPRVAIPSYGESSTEDGRRLAALYERALRGEAWPSTTDEEVAFLFDQIARHESAARVAAFARSECTAENRRLREALERVVWAGNVRPFAEYAREHARALLSGSTDAPPETPLNVERLRRAIDSGPVADIVEPFEHWETVQLARAIAAEYARLGGSDAPESET